MIKISIKTNFRDVQRRLNALSADVERRVVPAALNKVGAKAKTEMTRAITSEFNIKSADVNRSLRLSRAGRALNQWRVILDPFASSRRGRSLNLIHFIEKSVSLSEAARRRKSGTLSQLRFSIKKSGGKKTIKGAFIGNKGRTVFVRTDKSRLPIEALSTIGIPQMFNTKRISARVVARIEKELPVEFDRAIKAVLAGNIR